MLPIIKRILEKILDDIDAGNSNITDEEAHNIIEMFLKHLIRDEGMSKYQACSYLHCSRASFDNYVKAGLIPKGKHVIGFKEKRWYKKDLDNYINTYKNEKIKNNTTG